MCRKRGALWRTKPVPQKSKPVAFPEMNPRKSYEDITSKCRWCGHSSCEPARCTASQDRRLLPPEPGRGGHRRRPDGGAEPRDYLFTNYREHGYALARGIEPGPRDGRAVRQGDRRLARPRRLDAHVRHGAAAAGRLRHRRRPDAAGHRRRAGAELRSERAGRRSGRCARSATHDQHRRVPRVAEPGRAVEAARRVRDRQQRLRHGHVGRAGAAEPRPAQEGVRLRHPGRAGRRQRRRSPCATPRARRSNAPGCERQAALLEAIELPAAGPLGGGPGTVPHPRRTTSSCAAPTRSGASRDG